MQLEDRGGVGLERAPAGRRGDGHATATASPGLTGLQTTFRAGVPMIYADVDRVKAKSLGVPLDTSSARSRRRSGSAYVNDFNKFGRTYQVRVQADQRFRLEPEDIKQLEVRDRQGQDGSAGHAACKIEKRLGPQIIPRYNLYPVGRDHRRGRAGLQLGTGLESDGADGRRKLPRVDGLRMDRHVVPGEAGRLAGDLRLRPGRADGLPGAGRPVRELDHAGGRDPRRAAGAAGHGRRRRPARAWTTTSTRRSASS